MSQSSLWEVNPSASQSTSTKRILVTGGSGLVGMLPLLMTFSLCFSFVVAALVCVLVTLHQMSGTQLADVEFRQARKFITEEITTGLKIAVFVFSIWESVS